MKKNKIVIFTPIGARIITAADPKPYMGQKNILINPDLSKVKGVPPQFWVRQGGRVVEMSRPRKLARKAKIKHLGRIWQTKRNRWPTVLKYSLCAILGAAASGGLLFWLMK